MLAPWPQTGKEITINTGAPEDTPVSRTEARVVYNARPIRVTYVSLGLRLVRKVVFLIPLLLGFWEETQVLHVDLLAHVYENLTLPLRAAYIAVSDPRLDLYSAQLSIVAHLEGMAYYMHHWFFSSAVLGVIATAGLLGAGLVITITTTYLLIRHFTPTLVEPSMAEITAAERVEQAALELEEALRNDPALVYDERTGIYNLPLPLVESAEPGQPMTIATSPATPHHFFHAVGQPAVSPQQNIRISGACLRA